MPTLEELAAEYGFVGALATTIPEVGQILVQAANEQWTPERFQKGVQDSTWWKSSTEQRRQWQTLYATDPATFTNNWSLAADKVNYMASEMGYAPDARTSWDFATAVIENGWDDDQIRRKIAQTMPPVLRDGQARGEVGDISAQLTLLAGDYGIPMTPDEANKQAANILSGTGEVLDYELYWRQDAKKKYAHLAPALDAGRTLRDIADPFIAQMAQTLELNPTDLNLQDRNIQKALDSVNADGTHSTQPLWQFERALKDDARWDKTINARNESYDLLSQIGKDFGFSS